MKVISVAVCLFLFACKAPCKVSREFNCRFVRAVQCYEVLGWRSAAECEESMERRCDQQCLDNVKIPEALPDETETREAPEATGSLRREALHMLHAIQLREELERQAEILRSNTVGMKNATSRNW